MDTNMKKRKRYILIAGVMCAILTGCGSKEYAQKESLVTGTEQNTDVNQGDIKNNENVDSAINNDEKITFDKMNEIINEVGLENAVDYDERIEDVWKNQIIFLCESQSGRYKAYGFISPEYGMQGILIDNIIENTSNHNYFLKKWVYSAERPTLSESDDFYQVTFTVGQSEEEGMQEIYFTTYDTGTMSVSYTHL